MHTTIVAAVRRWISCEALLRSGLLAGLLFSMVNASADEPKGGSFTGELIAEPDLVYGGAVGAALAMSSDGTQFIHVAGNLVQLRDTATHEVLANFLPKDGNLSAVAISPDRTRIVIGTSLGNISFWNALTGKKMKDLSSHSSKVTSLAFSPDASKIVSGSLDGHAYVISLSNGSQLRNVTHKTPTEEDPTLEPITCVAFATNSETFATGGTDNIVQVWQPNLTRSLLGHTGDVSTMAFSPDGATLVTGSLDNTIRRWNWTSGAQLGTVTTAFNDINALTLSPDGTLVLAALAGRTAKLWNLATGTLIQNFQGHTNSVLAVGYSASANKVVTGAADSTVRVWNISTGVEDVRLTGHTSPVLSVAVSGDEQQVLSGSSDATLRIWNAADGIYETSIANAGGSGTAVSFLSTPERVLSTSGSQIFLWNTQTRVPAIAYAGHTGTVNALCTTPDGRYMLTGSNDRSARLWELDSGAELARIGSHPSSVTGVSLSDDGSLALTISSGYSEAALWDVKTNAHIRRFTGATEELTAVSLTGDGAYALIASSDGYARLYSTELNAPLVSYDHGGSGVTSAKFAPDGATVITGAVDNAARIFDTQSGTELLRYTGHYSKVTSVAFAPVTGAWAVSGSSDTSAHRWNTAPGCKERCENDTADADSDGLSDCYEVCVGTDPALADTDLDGMGDKFEVENYLARATADANADRDGDGATNFEEFTLGLIAFDPDIDNDNMLDGYELDNGLDVFVNDAGADTDGDGVSNLTEQSYGSSPQSQDTDGDTMNDDYEIAYGLNPVTPDGSLDRDRDGLSNIEESLLGLNPRDGDTDGDELSDGYEVEAGLDPFDRDSLRDPDGDGLTSIQEYWAHTDPMDGNDPPIPTYVSPSIGSDSTGTGTIDKPFLTISAALADAARYSYLYPPSLVALAGTYSRTLTVPSSVTLSGVGPETVFSGPRGLTKPFLKMYSKSTLKNCTVTLNGPQTVGAVTLLQLDESPVLLEEVHFVGNEELNVTGITISNESSGTVAIRNCTFQNLATGIASVDSNPQIARCVFDTISGRAILVLASSQNINFVPQLGNPASLQFSGFNRFRNLGGTAIELERALDQPILAGYNDWGVYTEEEIAGLIELLGTATEASIELSPALLTPLEDGDLAVIPTDAYSNLPLTDSSASVTINGVTQPADVNGIAFFPDSPIGEYDVFAEADLHCDANAIAEVTVSAGVSVVVVPMEGGLKVPGAEAEEELCMPLEGEGVEDGEGLTEAEGATEGEAEVDGEGEGEGEGLPEGEDTAAMADAILDRFNSLDTDGNGTLSFAEVRVGLGLPSSRLVGADTNQDGLLSFGELQRQLTTPSPIHSADTNGNRTLSLAELLRILQIHAAGGYDCAPDAAATEDGYVLRSEGAVAPACRPHASDYRDGANGVIDLTETLRAIQLFSFGDIASCPGNFEDNFCASN